MSVPKRPSVIRPCDQCGIKFQQKRCNHRWCSKACSDAAKPAYGRTYRKEHRDEKLAMQRSWRQRNKRRFLDTVQRYRKNHPEKTRQWAVKHIYGLTPEQDTALGMRCHICGMETTICSGKKGGGRTKRTIDHDHVTGKIRGVLCGLCNAGLGHFRDNPRLLMLAIEYLWRAGGEKTA